MNDILAEWAFKVGIRICPIKCCNRELKRFGVSGWPEKMARPVARGVMAKCCRAHAKTYLQRSGSALSLQMAGETCV